MKKKKEITIPDPHYQPSKSELEEDMRVKSNPRKAAKAILRPVKVRHKGKR